MVLLEELIAQIAADAPEEAAEQAQFAADSDLLSVDRLPREYLARVLQLLRDPGFLAHSQSWRLAHLLMSKWDLVAATDHETIFAALEWAYDKHGDFMGAFVIAEVIAEKLGGEAALQVFDRLATCAMPARALVPHGLDCLGREPGMRDAALARLNAMAGDADSDVRDEVALALGHLQSSPSS